MTDLPRYFMYVSILCVPAVFSPPAHAQSRNVPVIDQGLLAAGELRRGEIEPGTRHRWRISSSAGDYQAVRISKNRQDVFIRLFDSRDSLRQKFDKEAVGSSGSQLKFSWISDITGIWRLELEPYLPVRAGAYEIRLEVSAPADSSSSALQRADSLFHIASKIGARAATRDQGRALYQEILEVQEALLGPRAYEVGETLKSLAALEYAAGNYQTSRALYHRTLEVFQQSEASNGEYVAVALFGLGRIARVQGRYAAALRYTRQAADTVRAIFPADHPRLAFAEQELGSMRHDLGQFEAAEQHLLRALEIREANLRPAHPELAYNLNRLYVLYVDMNTYYKAEPMIKRSLAIFKATHGPEHPFVATTLSNLGAIYWFMGRIEEAQALHTQALALENKIYGPGHLHTTVTMENLANAERWKGNYRQADSLYRAVLKIRVEAFGEQHPAVANILLNTGSLHSDLGDFATADSLYRRALTIREDVYDETHFSIAEALNRIVQNQLAGGNADDREAETMINRALAIWEKTPGSPNTRLRAYEARGRLWEKRGNMQQAIADYGEAIRLAERARGAVSGGQEKNALFFERFIGLYNRMVHRLIEAGDAEQALVYAERSRARTLLDQFAAAGIDLRTSVPAPVRASLVETERLLKTRIAGLEQQLRLLRADRESPEAERRSQRLAVQDSLAQAESRLQSLFDAIRNSSSLWRNVVTRDGTAADLATLQHAVLSAQQCMLLYQIGDAHSYVFYVPPAGRQMQVIPLTIAGPEAGCLNTPAGALTRDKLEAFIIGTGDSQADPGLQLLLSRPPAAASPVADARLVSTLDCLTRILIPEAIRPFILQSEETIIIPDGALHLLPFETLVLRAGPTFRQTRFWLDEGPALRYAPSATLLADLTSLPATTESQHTGGLHVLTLANPRFSLQPAAAQPPAAVEQSRRDPGAQPAGSRYSLSGGSLSPLPGTLQEARAVRSAFKNRGRVVMLLNETASEAALRQALPGKQVVHIATHGLVDQDRSSLFAALALSPPPMISSTEDDGFLQLHEIYELDLRACELAILSACQTNFGPYFAREGSFALSRGFLAAGARRVVASHWNVDDASTAALMSHLFKAIAAHEGDNEPIDYSRALWEAKKQVRRQRRWAASYYWAPFVLTGKS